MEYGDKDFGLEPTRRVVDTLKLGIRGGELDGTTRFRLKTEQDGYNLKYQSKLSQYMERRMYFAENKAKAYAMIFNGCSKAIQS
mgnify:CR=1 FL=1